MVVGAGAFGGWTALELVRRGARVTLVDAWGAGHPRSSSGGETRVIRATYGSRAIYTTMARRALELWRAHDTRSGASLFTRTGVLWMFGDDDSFGRASALALGECGAVLEPVPLADARRALSADRLRRRELGPLRARGRLPAGAPGLRSRRSSASSPKEASYRIGAAPAPVSLAELLASGCVLARRHGARRRPLCLRLRSVAADAVPRRARPGPDGDAPGGLLLRRAGRRCAVHRSQPAGVDRSQRPSIYGIPSGNATRVQGRGRHHRARRSIRRRAIARATPAGIETAREFLARRFPALAAAPLVASEVCQYESSVDADFVIDRHPGGRERLDRRRRLGARLQDGPRRRRAGCVAGARRERARPGVSSGALRRVGRRWLANPLVVAEILRQRIDDRFGRRYAQL